MKFRPSTVRGRDVWVSGVATPVGMGIKTRRLGRRKPSGLRGGGFEWVFEDDDEATQQPSSRYSEHKRFVDRESSRRRRKGAAMDWFIWLVAWVIRLIATCIAAVVHWVFPNLWESEKGGARAREGREGGAGGWKSQSGRYARRNMFGDDDERGRYYYARNEETGPGEEQEQGPPGKGPDQSSSDPFQVLGIGEQNATLEDVAKAFRKLARKHHPDKNVDKNEEEKTKTMQIINAARVRCVQEIKRRTEMSGGMDSSRGKYASHDTKEPHERKTSRPKTAEKRREDIPNTIKRKRYHRAVLLIVAAVVAYRSTNVITHALWMCKYMLYNLYLSVKITKLWVMNESFEVYAYVSQVLGGFSGFSLPDWVFTASRWVGSFCFITLGVFAVVAHLS